MIEKYKNLEISRFLLYNNSMKKELRNKYLFIRKNVLNRQQLDEIIYQKVISHPKVKQSKTILVHVSFDDEVDTIKIIEYLLKYKEVAVPKIENNRMNFYIINNLSELSIGTFNILEPTTRKLLTDFSNAICITPGICFSKDKYRLGYGMGYYDRFITKHHLYQIGLCYQVCLLDKLPHNDYDQKVDEIITD